VKIAILKETLKGEARVAISVDAISKYIKAGAKVTVQNGAGLGSGIDDLTYKEAGATIAKTASTTVKGADVVLGVNAPNNATINAMKKNAHLIAMLNPHGNKESITACKTAGISSYSMEFLPRISRAQSMDVLSSQSNLAGYRAVIDAVSQMTKVIPMMMTAAGTITPAKVLVLGAGVAGLQAIATAKRLGAVVSAFDVRPAVKEQVESLGGTFVEVPTDESDGETSGGYAKEMSEDYKRKQSELIAETVAKQDIVICTALIPGRPAPELVTKEMVASMKTGSVIVDLAAIAGGNCKATKADKVTNVSGVDIIGYTNMPSRCAVDASALYARNLFNFVSTLMMEDGKLNVKHDDELIQGTLLTHGGDIVMDAFKDTPKTKGDKT